MIYPKLVTFDSKGRETARKLTSDEMVEVHYDSDPEGPWVCDVELTPRDFAPRCPMIRINLNDGLALTFDSPDDVEELLGRIRDAVNTAVEPLRRKVGAL